MPTLSSDLRNKLQKTISDEREGARDVAEAAAHVALCRLAVDQRDPFPELTAEQRALRVILRAQARQLGDTLDWEQPDPRSAKPKPPLVTECAYEQWHRLLFARFLAENNLLMHPEGVAVSLAECEELAAEEGLPDGWAVATRYASRMLPQIFRPDDPLLQVTFSPESAQALEKLLDTLPGAVFTADDSLGWVYQFWQTRRNKQVNDSGEKIDAATIGAVTQRFTEHYMVQFLLHNSVGAWWAARHPGEPLPLAPGDVDYLRRLDDGTPAAGSFGGWPHLASELRILDPCGGSGHFMVAALDLMVRIRMREEGLSERDATDAVLHDNLFMLEIDPRCTQIAAFNLALAAWKRGGFRPLPELHVACSGLRIGSSKDEWLALAKGEGQRRLRWSLRQLYDVFQQAPELGSLIDPIRAMEAGWETASFEDIQPLLEVALRNEAILADPDRAAIGVVAQGLARAAELLAGRYHLVITNVPYLTAKKQAAPLHSYCEQVYPDAKADLATVFMMRCQLLMAHGGSYALVTPQNWLFQGSYQRLREQLLREQTWNAVCWLGAGAFETISGEIVKPVLFVCTNRLPTTEQQFVGLDASTMRSTADKSLGLRKSILRLTDQSAQLINPDMRISLATSGKQTLLSDFAFSPRGIVSGDSDLWIKCFWELPNLPASWLYLQSTVSAILAFGGREHIIDWSTRGRGMLRPGTANPAYGNNGVAVSQTGDLPCTLYTGELYDNNTAAIVPRKPSHLSALWAFCSSSEFSLAVRQIDKGLKVTNATLVKVPFDLERWQEAATESGSIPQPCSDDPTQWLFKGHPMCSTAPLQVAVARLLGYRWPEQEDDGLTQFADEDGIVPLPAMSGELAASERLRSLLARAFGTAWTQAKEIELLASVEYAGKSLDSWLRDGFFKQHCRLFHNRPFIWHIWDGRRDGFSALVNYHKLDKRLLEKLTYTYVGDWIARQQESVRRGEDGADARLVAIKQLQDKLKLILEGEPPYDIFVRCKKMHEQPIGWEPDLNDGVRLNIRPFMLSGVLRAQPNIKWGIDRGKNPDGSVRDNDVHLTLAEKQTAREAQTVVQARTTTG